MSWVDTRLKHLCMDTGQYGLNLSADQYSQSGVRLIRTSDISSDGSLSAPEDGVHVDVVVEPRHRLRPGDVLLSRSGTLGRSFLVPHEANGQTFAGFLIRFRPRSDVDPRFLYYATQSLPFQEVVRSEAVASTIQNFNAERYSNIALRAPGVAEQRRIADFLDAETAGIDRLMRLRNEQLRLWNMRHQSILHSQFVANSANDGAGQDSTWLGRLPLSWTAPTIGRIARFTMGTTFPHEYQGRSQGDYPFIKVGDFQLADEVGNLGTAENWISRDVARTLGARIVPAGSVLYARVGAALLLNRRRVTTCPSVIDDNVRAITFAGGVPHYWRALLSLLDMGQLVNPGPVPSIGESQVAAVRVPTPPVAAQREIADRVEQHQRQLNQVTSAIQRQVNLLAERRQALITAAVTGQFDVSTANGRNVTDGVTA